MTTVCVVAYLGQGREKHHVTVEFAVDGPACTPAAAWIDGAACTLKDARATAPDWPALEDEARLMAAKMVVVVKSEAPLERGVR